MSANRKSWTAKQWQRFLGLLRNNLPVPVEKEAEDLLALELLPDPEPIYKFALVPVFSVLTRQCFVDVNLISPWTDKTVSWYLTSALKFGVKVDLLALSNDPLSVRASYIDPTDCIDPHVRLNCIYYRVNNGPVQMQPSQQRALVNFCLRDLRTPSRLVLEFPLHFVHHGENIHVLIEGELNLALGTLSVHAYAMQENVELLGYTITADRINYNRRLIA